MAPGASRALASAQPPLQHQLDDHIPGLNLNPSLAVDDSDLRKSSKEKSIDTTSISSSSSASGNGVATKSLSRQLPFMSAYGKYEAYGCFTKGGTASQLSTFAISTSAYKVNARYRLHCPDMRPV